MNTAMQSRVRAYLSPAMLTVNIKEDLDRRDEPLQLPLDGGHLWNVRWEGETVQTQAQPIINTHPSSTPTWSWAVPQIWERKRWNL